MEDSKKSILGKGFDKEKLELQIKTSKNALRKQQWQHQEWQKKKETLMGLD